MYIASSSSILNIHEFPSLNLVHNYQPESHAKGPIRSISWSREGSWLVSVTHAGVVEIMSVRNELKVLQTLPNISNATCAVFQNNSKKNLALGTENGLVMVYDMKNRTIKNRFEGCSRITHLEYTSSDTHIVAGCRNGNVLIFNNVTNGPPSMLRVPKSNSVSCLKTNNYKRNLILAGSNDGVVVVWDIHGNRPTFSKNVHDSPVNSVAFSPVNSDLIVSAGCDRQFCFHDIGQNKCIASVTVKNNMTAVDFSYDGTYFVMASQNGKMHVYDSRNIQIPVKSLQVQDRSIKHVAFQKILGRGVANVSNISIENSSPVEPKMEIRRNRINSDLFNLLTPTTVDYLEDKRKSVSSIGGGDSFLAALGLGNTPSSSIPDSNIKDFTNVSPLALKGPKDMIPTPKVSRSTNEKAVKQFSFTKVLPSATLQNDLCSLPVLSSMIKESIKEEEKAMIEEIESDMENRLIHMRHLLHRTCLEINMQLTKEFIKMEIYVGNCLKNINVAREREELLHKIEFLEEQIKIVSALNN